MGPSWTDDGNAYGPYSLDQLIQYASQGRVPKTSELKHHVKTKDAQVPVLRFPQVFDAISPQPPEPLFNPPV